MYKGVQRPEKGSDTVKLPLHHSITHTVPRSPRQNEAPSAPSHHTLPGHRLHLFKQIQ